MKVVQNCIFIVLISLSLIQCSGRKTRLSRLDTEKTAMKKCLQLSSEKRFEEAIECLEIFKSQFPNSAGTQEAEIYIGDNYYRKKEYLLAAEAYKAFTQIYPDSKRLDYALYRVGLAYEKEMPEKIDRDQSYLKEAKEYYSRVFRYFPESSYFSMAKAKFMHMERREAQKHFYVGNYYFKTGEYRASIPRFRIIVENFGHLRIAEEAFYKLTIAYRKLQKPDQANAIKEEFLSKYPNSRFRNKLVKKI